MATQVERSTATRGRLLEATIDALVADGYAATTTTVIAQRAGVSRGAQLHHYPTKAELVAAAVEHLATKLIDQFARRLARLPEPDRVEFIIEAMWSSFTAPLLAAWVELSAAARTDPELRAQLSSLTDRLRDTVLEHADGATPQVLLIITMTLLLLEGVTLNRRSLSRRDDLSSLVLSTWKEMVRAAFPRI